MKEILAKVFEELNSAIEVENLDRRESGTPTISKSEVTILGQTSLLVQPEITHVLSLAQTGDLDARLKVENFVKQKLKEILPKHGLLYDEDSPLIFIPKGSHLSFFLELKNLVVFVIDPESALVSKAVKAPDKNRQLIREAIAAGIFPKLIERILAEGGDLDDFT